jgi:hypothetical protein
MDQAVALDLSVKRIDGEMSAAAPSLPSADQLDPRAPRPFEVEAGNPADEDAGTPPDLGLEPAVMQHLFAEASNLDGIVLQPFQEEDTTANSDAHVGQGSPIQGLSE